MYLVEPNLRKISGNSQVKLWETRSRASRTSCIASVTKSSFLMRRSDLGSCTRFLDLSLPWPPPNGFVDDFQGTCLEEHSVIERSVSRLAAPEILYPSLSIPVQIQEGGVDLIVLDCICELTWLEACASASDFGCRRTCVCPMASGFDHQGFLFLSSLRRDPMRMHPEVLPIAGLLREGQELSSTTSEKGCDLHKIE